MRCGEAGQLLDDLVDGDLGAADRERLEAHLARCAACRAERRRLEGLLAAAAALPRERVPVRDLWPEIESRLRHESIRAGAAGSSRSNHWAGLAAAAAVVVALSSVTALRLLRTPPEPSASPTPAALVVPTALSAHQVLRAEREYERAAAALIAAVDERRDALSPETREVVERNLAVIDEALAELHSALERDPGNQRLAGLLSATHRRKVEVLQRVVRLSQL